MQVQVIVVKCQQDRVYGERLHDETYTSLKEAADVGNSKLQKGMCVIVRPSYNEKIDNAVIFREWRSFDGAAFKECRWNSHITPSE